MEARLRGLLTDEGPQLVQDSSLDRVPFYPVYNGFNDRTIMELVGAVYRHRLEGVVAVTPNVTPDLEPLLLGLADGRRKTRVAFISRYFGVYEPHGMLLDGIMAYLPRDQFYVIAMPIVGNDGKPLSYVIRDSVDEVVQLSLGREHALAMVEQSEVDIVVFADTLSEPQAHFLAQSRLAPVQVAFWGNPVTSASSQIDYFVSADGMEHPYRTRIPDGHDPYSEQVVLLDGQGIWYFSAASVNATVTAADPAFAARLLEPPETPLISKEVLDLPAGAVVFFCPQSVFKMHPHYDEVLAEIVSLSPLAYVVVTQGRRKLWSDTYHRRLRNAIHRRFSSLRDSAGGEAHLAAHQTRAALLDRLISIPRTSAQFFDELLRGVADVMLHPFPFDGRYYIYCSRIVAWIPPPVALVLDPMLTPTSSPSMLVAAPAQTV
jgi:predicted O-linked N-acetylglucosamine transferase (SPINDLY family)